MLPSVYLATIPQILRKTLVQAVQLPVIWAKSHVIANKQLNMVVS